MSTTSKSKKSKPAKAGKPKTTAKTAKKAAPQKPAAPVKPAPVKAAPVAAPEATGNPAPVRKDSKLDALIRLLSRPEGATLEDMVAETGWQKHTVRSALSHALAKKRKYEIVSDKPKGEQRIYKIAAAISAQE